MKRFLLIGGGGFAKEVAEVIELNGDLVIGYVAKVKSDIPYRYLGTTDHVSSLRESFDSLNIAFGAVDRKSLEVRNKITKWVVQMNYPSSSIISPHATISKGAKIGQGSFIAHRCVLSVDSLISDFCIVNTGGIIGHDVIVSNNVIIAPGAFIGGSATIGPDTLIGPNAVVLQEKKIGRNVIVSTGTAAFRDLKDCSTVIPSIPKVAKSDRDNIDVEEKSSGRIYGFK